MFDLDRLRRNWAHPEPHTDDAQRVQLDPAVLPIDIVSELPRQMRALRESCKVEFSEQMVVLDQFLKEIESAGLSLLRLQTGSDASPTAPPVAGLELSAAKELTTDSFLDDPEARLMGALSGLEDLLEVFMTPG